MLGDLPKAINDAELALERDKNNARAHFVLGNCYNDMNQLNKALAEYNQCIQLNQNEADFYFKRAIVYGKQQKFRDCLNDLSICLYYNPYYYEAYYWQGVAKVNLGENPCSDFQVAARNNYQPAIDAYNKHCR